MEASKGVKKEWRRDKAPTVRTEWGEEAVGRRELIIMFLRTEQCSSNQHRPHTSRTEVKLDNTTENLNEVQIEEPNP